MQDSLKLPEMTLVISLIAASAFGQAPSRGPKPAPAKAVPASDYSKEPYIIEKLRTVASFENDGSGSRAVTGVVRVQSEAGVQQWGVLTVGYSSGNEEVEIQYVRVRKKDGTVVETPADSVQDVTSDVTRAAPMYSDYHEKHVAVKGLGVGDVLEYQVTTRLKSPLIPGQFWLAYDFQKAAIVLDEEVEVDLPKDREVKVKSPNLEPVIAEEGARRIYTWKTSNLEHKDNEEAPRDVPPPAILVSSFKSWDEVGRWWNGLELERVTPTPEIKAKALALTRSATTREEKVHALYNYVATQFRYISISFGIGRYQPHAAAEVLKNEYGDCKDKHTLLASLLAAVDIDAYPALINSTRQIDPDVPSPGQFDHVITVVPSDNNLIWLDTTTEVAPLGWLVPNLRDTEALVIPASKSASLAKTPADSPVKNSLVFEVEGELDEAGTLTAKVERKDRGDSEVLLRAVFRQVPQTQWKDLVQRLSYLSGFGGDVSQVTASDPESTDQPFHFSYTYVRKDYSDWSNHRISPPLQLCSLVEFKDAAPHPTTPLKLGTGDYECKSKIVLPKGNTPVLLPPVDLVRDFAEYHSSYSFNNGVFEAERRLTVKLRELPSSRRSDYVSLQKAVSGDEALLTSINVPTADLEARADQMSADELNAAAASLIEQKRDFSLARDLLLKATAKDPNHKWAWNNLGRAYAALGSPEEAVKAYKKQIEVNPNDEYAYKNLGWIYMGKKQYDDAIAAYRQHIKIHPQDKEVYGYLGWTLGAMGKWDEAAQVDEQAAALNERDPYTYTQWAHALLKEGKTEKARQQLDRALDLDSSPLTLNNVAWELADAGVDLDRAEEEAKLAVDKTAANLVGTPSFDVPSDYTQKLGTLGNFLDTLGWVYFKKGELETAEPCLVSAHELATTSSLAEHIALLRARQGKFDEALRYYAYSRREPGWTGQSDHELEKYLTEKSGGKTQLLARLMDAQTFNDAHSVSPPGGSFTWPENSTATKASVVDVAVITDESGKVTDAEALSGDEPFRSAALADARKLRLPAIAWPGHALATLRSIGFLYLPPSMKSSEKRVKAWWGLGKPPAGNVSLASADGNHLISVPARLVQGVGNSASQGTNASFVRPSPPDYLTAMQQGAMLRQEKNLDGAITSFRKAISAEPSCAACHRVLADTLAQGGYRALAIAEYKEVVRLEPDNADSHFMLGAQLEAEGATRANSGYHFDPKSRVGRPASSTLPKSARTQYEAALMQYKLAYQLAPDNKSYADACERLARELKRP